MSRYSADRSRNPFRVSRGNSHAQYISNPTEPAANHDFSRSQSPRTRQPPFAPPSRQMTQGFSIPARNAPRPVYRDGADDRSTELLLPPDPGSRGRYLDEDSQAGSPPQVQSPIESPVQSGRTSLDSDTLPSAGVWYEPYHDDSPSTRPPSEDGDITDINTQTVAQRYNILPSSALLLFPEEVEKDDWLHNPVPGEKEPRNCELFSKRGLVNVGGLMFLTIGLLLLFIGYPLVSFVDKIFFPLGTTCQSNPECIRADLPLLQNVRQGLIDPDTPDSVKTRTARDGSTQTLVFSDEFNKPGRTFYEQDDAYFQAVDLWYGATQDLEWYDPDAITTADGTLTIQFDQFQNHGLNYRSGMLQSWNQMCFKGGYIEASISLPGNGETSGFWPGFWTMGNLGRPGYLATTEGLWPYSYDDVCDYGISPNQSSLDGLSWLPGMRLPACTCSGATHPSPGKSRSSPEIDALEASVGYLGAPTYSAVGTVSQSFQLAPFDIWYQPNYDFVEVYDPTVTMMNPYRGGPLQQAFSGLSNLNNDWYNNNAYQNYAFEYSPGGEGYCSWFVGDKSTWTLDARSIGPNGNIGQRVLPEEPMAIVANLGMALNFAPVNLTGLSKLFPGVMRIDYIRIYQGDDGEVTCDPEGYPTTEYIANHPRAYQNAQKTSWASSGYKWPKNDFVHGCND